MTQHRTRIERVETPGQVATTAKLAREIWTEHYVPIIGPEQVEYMLEKYQSEAAIAAQLETGYEYYLLTRGEEPVGYAALVPKVAQGTALLSKIYVHKSVRGYGHGRALLEHIEARCRELGIARLWLTVNKHNRRSIAWYERMGFVHAGPIVQEIGEGFVMDDYRMEKQLSTGDTERC